MQKRMVLAWGPVSDGLNMRMSLGDSNGNSGGSEGEEEWHGINGFSNRDDGDLEFEGNGED